MIHTKRVIFMILPLLFVPLVYGLSSTPDACAVPPDPNYGSASASCSTNEVLQRKTCCWYLPDGETIRCQSCKVDDPNDCRDVHSPLILPGGAVGGPPTGGVFEQLPTTPAPPPLFGENGANVPPTGGIEQPFTSIPFQQIPQGTVQGPKGPLGDILQGGGVLPELQQTLPSPTTPPIGGISEQPPLFGRNVGNAPLGGFFGQQPTTATTMVVPPTPILTPEPTPDLPTTPDQPVPMFGLAQQPTTPTLTPPPLFGQIDPEGPTLAEEGEDIQPMNTTFPTPQPFPPPTPGFKAPQTSIDISPDLAPEDDQDETDDGRNDIIPDTGITEQPETQQPEDSSEGAETAGPLT